MGELEPWIDENFIRNLWFQMGEQVNVKMIRDKFSGYAVTFSFSLRSISFFWVFILSSLLAVLLGKRAVGFYIFQYGLMLVVEVMLDTALLILCLQLLQEKL
jgi:hypothetical protein